MHDDIKRLFEKIELNSHYGPLGISNVPLFQKIDEGLVDDEKWVCVAVRSGSEACSWLRKHDAVNLNYSSLFKEFFEMPEKLYMMLLLRFQ